MENGHTCSSASFAARVHSPRTKLLHLLQELTLGRTRVSNNADIYVPSKFGHLSSLLGHTSKQHQQYSSLDLFITCDREKEEMCL